MKSNLQNKVIIVTGASHGFGKALSFRLAKLGAKVALVARTEKLLQEVKKEIEEKGGTAEYFICDVTDWEQVKNTVKAIVKTFGTIDILLNGAGIWTRDEFEAERPDLIENAFKVNSIGPIYFIKEVLPIFKKKNSGHIFNVISRAGLDLAENKDWLSYTATKWAMTGYTKALKYSLEETKIKVTGFYPGAFESSIFETAGEKNAHNQPWMMKTSQVVNAAIYALDTPDNLLISSTEISLV